MNRLLLAEQVIGLTEELLVEDIESDAKKAYNYARNVTHAPVPELEPVIAKTHMYSYHYASNVLKGRFELGEPAIAKDAWYSYNYALDVLNGRFELGEPKIRKSKYWNDYKKAFGIESERIH